MLSQASIALRNLLVASHVAAACRPVAVLFAILCLLLPGAAHALEPLEVDPLKDRIDV